MIERLLIFCVYLNNGLIGIKINICSRELVGNKVINVLL